MTLRTLTLMALTCATMSISAAGDSYRDALKRMTLADSTDTALRKAQMRMVVTGTVSSQLLGMSEEQERLVATSLDRYLDEQFVDDMVDASLPCYRDWMTQEQMEQLTAMLMQPDVRAAKLHVHTTTMNVASSVGRTLQDILKPMLSGRPAELPAERSCPSAYKVKFDAYWAAAGIDRMVTGAIDGMASGPHGGGDTEQLNALKEALMMSMKILMQNEFVDNITEQELDCLLSMMRTDAFAANVNALSCMTADMGTLYEKWLQRFVQWAKDKGV